jgi:hypothetical protein
MVLAVRDEQGTRAGDDPAARRGQRCDLPGGRPHR